MDGVAVVCGAPDRLSIALSLFVFWTLLYDVFLFLTRYLFCGRRSRNFMNDFRVTMCLPPCEGFPTARLAALHASVCLAKSQAWPNCNTLIPVSSYITHGAWWRVSQAARHPG